MCAARVEVLSESVIAKYDDEILGQGRGVYELRDYDFKLDFPYVSDPATQGISSIDLNLGRGIGKVKVRTRQADTTYDVTASRTSVGLNMPTSFSTGGWIFGKEYGAGEPELIEIKDAQGNPLVRIHHVSKNV